MANCRVSVEFFSAFISRLHHNPGQKGVFVVPNFPSVSVHAWSTDNVGAVTWFNTVFLACPFKVLPKMLHDSHNELLKQVLLKISFIKEM